jgi:putative ABC transport system substrate-binding protein
MVRRREFIKIAAGSALGTLPLSSNAQQAALPVVGFINAGSAENYKRQVAAFLEGLAKNGFIDGHKVNVEYRWAEGQYDPLPALIAELINRQAAVISVTGSTAAVQAAIAATRTIPIVFVIGGDPVKFGLVESADNFGLFGAMGERDDENLGTEEVRRVANQFHRLGQPDAVHSRAGGGCLGQDP